MANMISQATISALMKNVPKAAVVGEIWHRVDGQHRGDDEAYEGMELSWTVWRCVKTTPSGAWFECTEWVARRRRFAMTSGARALHRTDHEALEALVARKRRQVKILEGQATVANDTLAVARAVLASMKAAA